MRLHVRSRIMRAQANKIIICVKRMHYCTLHNGSGTTTLAIALCETVMAFSISCKCQAAFERGKEREWPKGIIRAKSTRWKFKLYDFRTSTQTLTTGGRGMVFGCMLSAHVGRREKNALSTVWQRVAP